MNPDQLKTTFDQQAPTYEAQWSRLAPFRDSMHLLLGSIFQPLAHDARVLCVGAGTGAEILRLAARFPGWRFTAVEPSSGMLDECRRRLAENDCAERCLFHEGYLDSLPASAAFDAATCLLVSQFLLDVPMRTQLFAQIARRLRPGGVLASADLSFEVDSPRYQGMLEAWMRTLAATELTPQRLQQIREAYERDVAVLAPEAIEAIIMTAGFEKPVQFFQAGLMRAWYAARCA